MHAQTNCKSMRNEGIPAGNRGGVGRDGHFHHAIALVGECLMGNFDGFHVRHDTPPGHSMIVVGVGSDCAVNGQKL